MAILNECRPGGLGFALILALLFLTAGRAVAAVYEYNGHYRRAENIEFWSAPLGIMTGLVYEIVWIFG